MVDAFRCGFLGVSDVDVRLAHTITIGAAVVRYVTCVCLLQRGVGMREEHTRVRPQRCSRR